MSLKTTHPMKMRSFLSSPPLLFGAAGNIWIEGMTGSLKHCTADRLTSLQLLVAALKPLKIHACLSEAQYCKAATHTGVGGRGKGEVPMPEASVASSFPDDAASLYTSAPVSDLVWLLPLSVFSPACRATKATKGCLVHLGEEAFQ